MKQNSDSPVTIHLVHNSAERKQQSGEGKLQSSLGLSVSHFLEAGFGIW